MIERKRVKKYGVGLSDWLWGIQEWNLDIHNFTLWITGEDVGYYADDFNRQEPGVEYKMSARVAKNLRILSNLDPNRTILIHMKSCGGDWNEGMAIFDAIKTCPNKVVILSYTHARSMTSLIFQAADKRVMMPNSYFMIHKGDLGFGGTYTQFFSFAKWIEKTYKTMIDIYVDSMKKNGKFKQWGRGRIAEMIEEEMRKKEEVYLTPREAIEWGFADEIFDGDWDKLRVFPQNRNVQSRKRIKR